MWTGSNFGNAIKIRGKTATVVLTEFSQREAEAKEAYRRYIAEGVVLGRRPELVMGSGSLGEWFVVKSQRRRRIEESTDERILGSGAFVERVLKEADARTVRQNAFKKTKRYTERVVTAACKKDGISLTELRSREPPWETAWG